METTSERTRVWKLEKASKKTKVNPCIVFVVMDTTKTLEFYIGDIE